MHEAEKARKIWSSCCRT